ncbi:hypothetical protein BCR33DRAFT_767620 [Rhizoclosmatium globosum]|uniref:Uncharacterized protein n=1 Tax=Rhizoclosmatium globosum TaxID=329046 RepID=A0A1Y2C2Q0_9FUNG|nr:hypothetical protein BCR33DRAFT_767620 [Rhizoclosmatium globosum]|eukprot:ORY41323.1 hypothetical protein BCR33DRAFT_767620 [Rhizoclosmatium globosum]
MILFLLSATGYHIFEAMDLSQLQLGSGKPGVSPVKVTSSIFATFMQTSYMWYQWHRTFPILHTSLHPIFLRVLTTMMAFTSFLFSLQPILMCINLLANKIIITTSGVLLACIDLTFLVTSLQTVFSRTLEVIEFRGSQSRGAQYYKIVARYSAQASLGMVLAFITFIGSAVTKLIQSKQDETNPVQWMTSLYYCFTVLLHLLVLGIGFSLVQMKIVIDATKERVTVVRVERKPSIGAALDRVGEKRMDRREGSDAHKQSKESLEMKRNSDGLQGILVGNGKETADLLRPGEEHGQRKMSNPNLSKQAVMRAKLSDIEPLRKTRSDDNL